MSELFDPLKWRPAPFLPEKEARDGARVIGLGLRHSMGIRSHPQHESDGLDDAEHAESAYELATTRGGGLINPGR